MASSSRRTPIPLLPRATGLICSPLDLFEGLLERLVRLRAALWKQLRALLFTALLLVSSLALSAQTTKYAAIIKALGQTELLDEDRRTQLATLLAQDSALSTSLWSLTSELSSSPSQSIAFACRPARWVRQSCASLPLASGQGPARHSSGPSALRRSMPASLSSAQVAKPFRLRHSFAFPARKTSSAGCSSL